MKRLLLLLGAALTGTSVFAQLLTWSPAFPKETDNITITVDATKGNTGLLGYTGNVYVHVGAITSLSTGPSNWLHVPFTWGSSEVAALAVPAGPNKWSFTINNPKTFFNLAAGEQLKAIAVLFRTGGCTSCQAQRNADGSDMYVPIYTTALAVRIDQPPSQPKYVRVPEPQNWSVGTVFTVKAYANKVSTMKLYHNGTQIASGSTVDSLVANATITAMGNQQIIAEAFDGSTTRYDTISIFVSAGSPVAALPTGAKDGINYEPGDTSAILVLRAPNKNKALIIGDFNNWTQDLNYIMNKTPDGKYFWIRLRSLTPGTEYAYQYIVDDTIKIADPFTEKILDQGNDPFISAATYPGLKPYPSGQSGIVSVLQTAMPSYSWSSGSFNRPDKRSLVIYELLLRDFINAHDWKTLKDTLSYLKRLGVNAVEIMPFNEFEGNSSWGYNSMLYFAPDKYYGPKNTLKEFIDSCHKNGIAVIMDIVLNHTFGPSPLARLYWNSSANRPASNNPWYNAVQPHAFGFGDDFNHESIHTKEFFNRVLQHWITEYKIDGYRFDFSKGLTQKVSTNDANFSAYDASRIANIMGYANAIKAVDPNSYIILEHFADNTEEKALADSGLLLWSTVWTQYQEAARGALGNSNFDGGIYSVKGWTNPHLVTFMESHDEERITYKAIKDGNSSGNYNIRDTATALKRMEMNAAFMLTIPGPKMIWQFGELGYDYSRCYLSTNGEGGDCDKKLEPKPIRWDYQNDIRRKAVFTTYSKLNALRFHPLYKNAFMSGIVNRDLGGAIKWITVNSGDTSRLLVVGNFGVTGQTGNVTFPAAGTWYDYLNNVAYTATGNAEIIGLQPGEFKVYVNRNVNNIATTPVINVPAAGNIFYARAYPNPASGRINLELDLPKSNTVTVDLYNSTGQHISTLYKGFLVKGGHTLNLRNQHGAKGQYFISINTTTTSQTLQVTFQ